MRSPTCDSDLVGGKAGHFVGLVVRKPAVEGGRATFGVVERKTVPSGDRDKFRDHDGNSKPGSHQPSLLPDGYRFCKTSGNIMVNIIRDKLGVCT